MPEWIVIVVAGLAGWMIVSVVLGMILGQTIRRLSGEPPRVLVPARRRLWSRQPAGRLMERQAA
jgi:hypothetical protein